MKHAKTIAKHVVGLTLVVLVVVGVIALGASITRSTAVVQVAQSKAASDGTTHDLTIVWPTGKTEIVQYAETVTPKHSEYIGPKNLHQTNIDMISFNPLDSATKAGERLTPSTFAEGDRPSIQVTEDGMKTSKADGATAVGQGGANPVLGEFLGWGVIGILGIVGLVIIWGVLKWLKAEWDEYEPAILPALGIPPLPSQAPAVTPAVKQ
jgi:hypothetical protein